MGRASLCVHHEHTVGSAKFCEGRAVRAADSGRLQGVAFEGWQWRWWRGDNPGRGNSMCKASQAFH